MLLDEERRIRKNLSYCADLLAKEGSKALNSYVELFSPPSIIVSQLMEDIWGVSFPRACNV